MVGPHLARRGRADSLLHKHRYAMFADAVQQLSRGLTVKIAQVGAVQRRIPGRSCGRLKLNGNLPWNQGFTGAGQMK